jgi:hypothetical protein
MGWWKGPRDQESDRVAALVSRGDVWLGGERGLPGGAWWGRFQVIRAPQALRLARFSEDGETSGPWGGASRSTCPWSALRLSGGEPGSCAQIGKTLVWGLSARQGLGQSGARMDAGEAGGAGRADAWEIREGRSGGCASRGADYGLVLVLRGRKVLPDLDPEVGVWAQENGSP